MLQPALAGDRLHVQQYREGYMVIARRNDGQAAESYSGSIQLYADSTSSRWFLEVDAYFDQVKPLAISVLLLFDGAFGKRWWIAESVLKS